MNIGENDWLAQEYKREGKAITPEAARRLAKEHLLECDSHLVKQTHRDNCAADELKRSTSRSLLFEGSPGVEGLDWGKLFRKIAAFFQDVFEEELPSSFRRKRR